MANERFLSHLTRRQQRSAVRTRYQVYSDQTYISPGAWPKKEPSISPTIDRHLDWGIELNVRQHKALSVQRVTTLTAVAAMANSRRMLLAFNFVKPEQSLYGGLYSWSLLPARCRLLAAKKAQGQGRAPAPMGVGAGPHVYAPKGKARS